MNEKLVTQKAREKVFAKQQGNAKKWKKFQNEMDECRIESFYYKSVDGML